MGYLILGTPVSPLVRRAVPRAINIIIINNINIIKALAGQ